jgi:hypothetical protein
LPYNSCIASWRADLSLQKTPIDLQSLNLIDFHLLQWPAKQSLFIVLGALTSMLKASAQLRLENLALRQQLMVLRRSAPKRLKLTPADRIFWVWLRRVWSDWTSALMIAKAETVVAWHRKGFRLFWTWKIRSGKPGRVWTEKSNAPVLMPIRTNLMCAATKNQGLGLRRLCR